ncbi:hypothetical protein ACFX13_022077 [Malus domestica]
MSGKGGGGVASNGKGNTGISGIPVGSRKMVQSLKEIVNNCTKKPNLIRNFDTFLQSSRNPRWRRLDTYVLYGLGNPPPPPFTHSPAVVQPIKDELLDVIVSLDRGVEATPEDQQTVDQIARKLEAVNSTKEPLKSDLLNGKYER